jgi:hypothetical protein
MDDWEAEIKRMVVEGQPRQIVCKTRPHLKITKAKGTSVVAQVVESLLCKHKALTSNPSSTKKKKKKKERNRWDKK